MPAPGIPHTISSIENFDSVEEYVRYLAGILSRSLVELNWLLSGHLSMDNIKAHSITADRLSVKQLSAITADLGEITAGLLEAVRIIGSVIIGSTIKTAETGQRVELSSTDNLLEAVNEYGNVVRISPDISGTPGILFFGDQNAVVVGLSQAAFNIATSGATDIVISSTLGDIRISSGIGKFARFDSWAQIYSNASNQTLQDVINNLQLQLNALNARVTALENP